MIQPGAKVAHYEILSPLGKGGMGEVWRARDTKLDRDVAIKTLPEEFARDTDRLARFEREAKLLASLNHTNIAAIYGLEEHDGARFLILELVEGDTLADRLARGAVPVEESLQLALQIAEALDAAHEKGVIHRDLKPANIKVTPDDKVKVLDFGLAKAFAGDDAETNLSNSPTLSMQATQQGTILGTAAYMSPEQAKGKATDKRTDIWAFGCVLFELLTGKPAFEGDDVGDILGSVLKLDPALDLLPPNLHPRLREALERCLKKTVRNRYHDIADVRVDLERVMADPEGVIVQPAKGTETLSPRSKLPWVAALGIAAVIAATAAWTLKPETARRTIRFSLTVPESDSVSQNIGLALSPTGDRLVYGATRDGVRQLFLRSLEQTLPLPIEGTEGIQGKPFFSPDGEWVGFAVPDDGVILRVRVAGGDASFVARVPDTFLDGAAWGPDDTIVYATDGGLFAVAAFGGEPRPLSSPQAPTSHVFPSFLPDGRHVLITILDRTTLEAQLGVLSLETDEVTTLGIEGSNARYMNSGHLVFARNRSLSAVAFDADRQMILGEAGAMERGVWVNSNGNAMYSTANDGSLVYMSFPDEDEGRPLAWLDPDGTERERAVGVDPRLYDWVRVSPDGTQLTATIEDRDNSDIWIGDVDRGSLRQLTSDPALDAFPVWTPSGDEIVFWSDRNEAPGLYRMPADQSRSPELVQSFDESVAIPGDWADDGNTLIFGYRKTVSGEAGSPVGDRRDGDLGSLNIAEGGWTPLSLNSASRESSPSISPNESWIAYTVGGDDSESQIIVRRFPELTDQQRVSVEAAMDPVWSPNGDMLYYLRPGPTGPPDRVMGVPVTMGSEIELGDPRVMFERVQYHTFLTPRVYDIAPDGRMLIVDVTGERAAANQSRPVNWVLDWDEELKQRVPVP